MLGDVETYQFEKLSIGAHRMMWSYLTNGVEAPLYSCQNRTKDATLPMISDQLSLLEPTGKAALSIFAKKLMHLIRQHLIILPQYAYMTGRTCTEGNGSNPSNPMVILQDPPWPVGLWGGVPLPNGQHLAPSQSLQVEDGNPYKWDIGWWWWNFKKCFIFTCTKKRGRLKTHFWLQNYFSFMGWLKNHQL